MPRIGRGVVTTLLAAALVLAIAPAVSAHEEEQVGAINMVVGWGDEPTYAGFKNSVQLLLTQGDEPVTDIGDLYVDVTFGDQTVTLPLEPNFAVGAFGEPGDYRAWLTPTRPGSYTFRFVGTVAGQAIDQSFTSGPDTFSDVADPTAIQFPVQDPTAGALAERVEREAGRITEALDALEARAVAAEERAAGAEDDVSSARTIALVAVAVAVVAVAAAGAALVRRRR